MQFVGLFYTCRLPSYDFVFEEIEVSEACWVGLDTIDSVDILEPSKSIIKQYLQEI
jgi:hypothetical protein